MYICIYTYMYIHVYMYIVHFLLPICVQSENVCTLKKKNKKINMNYNSPPRQSTVSKSRNCCHTTLKPIVVEIRFSTMNRRTASRLTRVSCEEVRSIRFHVPRRINQTQKRKNTATIRRKQNSPTIELVRRFPGNLVLALWKAVPERGGLAL